MQPIIHKGELLAITTRRGAFLAPDIEELDANHPRRRLALALCQHAIEAGLYDADHALRHAARMLIPAELLRPGGYDAPVAEELCVPIELVRVRRSDLGQDPCWPTPAVPWADDRSYLRWLRGTDDLTD